MVLELTGRLLEHGVGECHFLTQRDSYAARSAAELGATVIDDFDFFRWRLDPKPVRRLRRAMSEIGADLVHVHGARAGLAYARAVKERGARACVYTVHGYHHLRKPWPLRALGALAERRVSEVADAVVFVCESDRTTASRDSIVPRSRQQRVIYNGVDFERLPPAAGSDPKHVGVLGRLVPQKDPLLVVEIAALLAEEGFRFTVIGGGALADEVADRIRRRGLESTVTLSGELPREEALAALAQAGAYLIPSRWEGLPVALVEAMGMGLPVVASAVDGIPEVVRDGETGVLVDTRDPERFARALRRLAGDPQLRARVIRGGRLRATQLFGIDPFVQAHRELYGELLLARHPDSAGCPGA
jgi:glycosyltransferase involved in cell wall biosynthesis